MSPELPLLDRIALVSGGAQGIGYAIAARFQRAGARVILLDRDAAAGAAAAARLSAQAALPRVDFVAADLLFPEQIEAALLLTRKLVPRVDLLVNNAGIEIEESFEETKVATWDRILGVNLRGAFLLTQATLPLIPEAGGAIVNISSIHATHAFPGSLAYATWVCARLGGWTGYYREPGPIVIFRGLAQFTTLAAGYRIAQASKPPERRPRR